MPGGIAVFMSWASAINQIHYHRIGILSVVVQPKARLLLQIAVILYSI